MSENPMLDAGIEILKERSKDLYDDGLKGATKEGGESIQAIVGLFNNVVLYPIKKANIAFRYKLEQFEEDLMLKSEKIPSNKLIEPPLTITGPTIESLKYTFDTKEIREMYINLLASAMNIDTVNLTHPAYVEIIKSMTSLDAIVFKNIVNLNRNIACASVGIGFDSKVYSQAMPKMFIPDLLGDEDPFLISSSVINLCRLGLITHSINTISGYNYDVFREHNYVMKRFEFYKKVDTKIDLNITIAGEAIFLNDFGTNFATVCL